MFQGMQPQVNARLNDSVRAGAHPREGKGEELLNAGRSASHSRLNLSLHSLSLPTPSPSQSGRTVLAPAGV